MLPLHVGTLLLHVPSRQVILTLPVNLKLAWQVNETFLPCRKSKPILRPFCGLPGSVQHSEKLQIKVQSGLSANDFEWIFDVNWPLQRDSKADVSSVSPFVGANRGIHVKVTGNHAMYDRSAWFSRVIMSTSRDLCCLPSVKKQKHDFQVFEFNV